MAYFASGLWPSGRRLGSRPFNGNGSGCVAGVNQRGSVFSSGEDLADQMPVVGCGFLLQPIVDSE